MILPAYARTMATYNRWQNRSLYREAGKLTDAQRKENRGAFFGSVHGTLSHILFADQIWLHRFTRGRMPAPKAKSIAESTTAIPDWSDLVSQRVAFDEEIIGWAKGLQPADLEGDLTWYSGALGKEVSRPVAPLIVHVFNHQTHHRGQVHCLLTGFGLKPDDTDLPFMPPDQA